MIHNILTLSDKRQLGVSKQGPSDGKPILYYHGIPGSRLEFNPPGNLLNELGIQIITLDRPGYGLSTPNDAVKGLTAFAKDAAQAMTMLSFDRFSVIGFSGGGPYALACASALGEKISSILLGGAIAPITGLQSLEGMNPLTYEVYRIAHSEPIKLEGILKPLAEDISGLSEQLIAAMSPADRTWMNDRYGFSYFPCNLAEALKQGTQGIHDDLLQTSTSWDFDLTTVKQPTTLLHGELDLNVPVEHAKQLAKILPNAHLEIQKHLGHYALFDKDNLLSALQTLIHSH